MIGEPGATRSSPPGHVVRDDVVPPGEGWAEVVRRGQILRIVDQAGKQGVDFLCYHSTQPEERYDAANTMKKARTILLTTGHVLYSDVARPMFTIVADTCGRHDTIGRMLQRSQQPHDVRGEGRARLPRDLSPAARPIRARAARHRGERQLFFQRAGGSGRKLADTVFVDGLSKAGDLVDRRAEMDALALISNCPQVNNPCAGLDPTPIRVVIWEAHGPPARSS